MAEEPIKDEMQYDTLAKEALRGVVRLALERAESDEGLPGDHHFYITFLTRVRGVEMHADLRKSYKDEMTIVLQHQYENLSVGPESFGVTLRFGGVPRPLVVPYAAVSRFYDPSVGFLLPFEVDPDLIVPEPEPEPEPDPSDDSGPKVVSLDKFRKK